MRIILPILLAGSPFFTAAVDSQVNFQGITGSINTPSAYTLQSGTFDFLYSKQVERQDGYHHYHSFNFAVGVSEYLEVSGRNASYSEDLGGGSDLSANIKFKLPYIPKEWFSISAGIQDLGGEVSFFNSKYIVASKSIFNDQLSLSVGVGKSDSSIGRLDGAFGAITYQPFEWLQLEGEYDGVDSNLGVKLLSPLDWFDHSFQLHSSLILSSSNEQLSNDNYFGIGFTLPISTSINSALISTTAINKKYQNKELITKNKVVKDEIFSDKSETELFNELNKLQTDLKNFGFEDISIGYTFDKNVVIRLSSLSTFGRNRLDSVGYILGASSDYLQEKNIKYYIELTENNILAEAYSGSLDIFRSFLTGSATSGIRVSSQPFKQRELITWVNNQNINSSRFKPRLTISPDLNTAMGTDAGMFDASVAIATQLQIDIWPGATLHGKYISQFYETKDYKDGYEFSNSRQANGLAEIGLSQSLKLPYNIYNMSTIGKYRHDFEFIRNQSYWTSISGKHRVELTLAKYFSDELGPATITCNRFFQVCLDLIESSRVKFEEPSIQVLGYKYYLPNYDLLVRLDAGKYWQADTGFTAEFERQFGDTTIRLRYKNTDSKDGVNNQFIGLSFSVPLTPRREFNTRYATIRGPNKFTYGLSTLIGDRLNFLRPGTGDTAFIANQNLGNLYFNNHRSGQAYLDRNQERLREVYLTYKNAE